MTFKRLYYHLKPYLPWSLRIRLRRLFALKKRHACKDIWPINDAASRTPENWPGWPDGKKFAFVLSHDVEGPSGLAKCRQLMELEKELGFRSSFNFVPEGDYRVTQQLREDLVKNGFEVGVHDLRHDGKLYWTREIFSENAKRINHYLKEWNATGFRSGFLFREPTSEIWRRKLDWVAGHGGMALVNVHPDYLRFSGEPKSGRTFPVKRYRELLIHVRDNYAGNYWHVTPNRLADFCASLPRK
jgi:hypothetical protein